MSIKDPVVVIPEIRVAEIVLELFEVVIKSKVIDSDVYAGMIVAAVAAQVLLASVMRMLVILRYLNPATIEALNFLHLDPPFSVPYMLFSS